MSIVKYGSVLALLLLTACSDNSSEAPSAKNLPTSQEGNLLRLGNATRAAGDLNAAEKLYLEAIAQSKGSAEPYLALANLYQSKREPLKAVNILKQGVAAQRDNAQLSLPLANLLIANGESQEAFKYANIAVKLTPDNPRAYNTQGVALDNAGRYEDAQKSYETALRLDGNNSSYIQNNLALSYIMSDDFSEAIRILEPLAKSAETNQTVRQNLALAYGMKGDEKTAKEWMMKDLSENEATQNLAFYKYYSKDRLASSRTTSDTAVVSVEARDLDVPKELLDDAKPTPKQVAMVPIMKPTRIASGTPPAPAVIAKAPEKPVLVKQAAVPATLTPPAQQVAFQAPRNMPITDPFDEDYKEENFANDVLINTAPTPLLDIEPAAGTSASKNSITVTSKELAPATVKTANAALPEPQLKPVR